MVRAAIVVVFCDHGELLGWRELLARLFELGLVITPRTGAPRRPGTALAPRCYSACGLLRLHLLLLCSLKMCSSLLFVRLLTVEVARLSSRLLYTHAATI